MQKYYMLKLLKLQDLKNLNFNIARTLSSLTI